MKARILMSVAAVAILVTASVAAPKLNLKGVKCVMNAKAAAKAKSSADYKGGKVYFCTVAREGGRRWRIGRPREPAHRA